MRYDSPTVFKSSVPGRTGVLPQKPDKTAKDMLPGGLLRNKRVRLPELSELDVVRHYTRLSRKNYSVDTNFYPLGSCTMKYNPRMNEHIAGLPGITNTHPMTPQLPGGEELAQGNLEALWETEEWLKEVLGMKAFTMQPMAGAQGELAAILLFAAYHRDKGNKKTKIICPDSAHGTNPATAALAGYEVVNLETVSTGGIVDPKKLKEILSDDIAGMMMTCPNTLGLFEDNLPKIVAMLREVDALLYYDGANANAILGHMRPGDVGFDAVHLNLHKTFSTPHGGGGPGTGPVGVSERLVPFLPGPRVMKNKNGTFGLNYDLPKSIGKMAPWYGNYAVYMRALAYMMRLGKTGLFRASSNAVLGANYMKCRLQDTLNVPYPRICMHEFVCSAAKLVDVSALDLAKGLLDRGYYAPTIYFPLIVDECLMIEPTESENKETMDAFCNDLIDLVKIGKKNPDDLHQAPVKLQARRMDETLAARSMVLTEDDI